MCDIIGDSTDNSTRYVATRLCLQTLHVAFTSHLGEYIVLSKALFWRVRYHFGHLHSYNFFYERDSDRDNIG